MTTTKTYWRNRLIALLILFAVVGALTLDRTPVLPESTPPSTSDALAARGAFKRFQKARGAGAKPFTLSWPELDTLARLGARSVGYRRVTVERDGAALLAKGSLPLRLGFWGNVALIATPGDKGQPEVSARIGRLPLPSFIIHPAIDFARYVLSWRRVDVPPIGDIVSAMEVTGAGVTATLNLPSDSGLVHPLGHEGLAELSVATHGGDGDDFGQRPGDAAEAAVHLAAGD